MLSSPSSFFFFFFDFPISQVNGLKVIRHSSLEWQWENEKWKNKNKSYNPLSSFFGFFESELFLFDFFFFLLYEKTIHFPIGKWLFWILMNFILLLLFHNFSKQLWFFLQFFCFQTLFILILILMVNLLYFKFSCFLGFFSSSFLLLFFCSKIKFFFQKMKNLK